MLLVGPLVLLVQDDESEIGHGGEDGAARADNDVIGAAPRLPPLVEALAGGEAAVEDGDTTREPGGEALDGLVGEGYLGREYDNSLVEGQAVLRRTQIDFGLAAAGDALEDEGAG